MLSPASPAQPSQPSPALSGKNSDYFSLLFSPKILKDREIMLFQNRKIKFWIHQIFNENQCFLMIFRRKLNVNKSTRRSCNGFQGAISALDTRRKIVLFSRVFRVLSEPLQDRRVDFFVLRAASGSSTPRTI